MCLGERESFSHLYGCSETIKIFGDWFGGLVRKYYPEARTHSPSFIVLGQFQTKNEGLRGSLSDLHIIIWKFVIIDITAVDTQGSHFDAKRTWKAALRRQRDCLDAHAEKVRRIVLASEGPLHSMRLAQLSDEVHPLVAGYDEDGEQQLLKQWLEVLDLHGLLDQ